MIKVLDRGFKEWWRGACNGKIGVGSRSPFLEKGVELMENVDIPCDVC